MWSGPENEAAQIAIAIVILTDCVSQLPHEMDYILRHEGEVLIEEEYGFENGSIYKSFKNNIENSLILVECNEFSIRSWQYLTNKDK